MAKNVFITGGAGFLGVHLARRLLKDGYRVTLFDTATLDAKDLFGKVDVVIGDVRNLRDVKQAVKSHDYVIHAAAALPILQSREEIFSVNVDGTRNVLEVSLAEGVKRLIFISTTAVYGVPKTLPEREDDPLDPIGDYGESKVEAENLCLSYQQKGISVNILRPKTFLGPERLGVFQLWFEAIYTGKRVFILGDGNNRYQLLAVSDVVDAIVKALQKRVDGEIFNIGAKVFGTWRSDLGRVIKFAKSKSVITSIPTFPSQFILALLEKLHFSPIAAWHYKTMPVDSYVSIVKAKKLLDWRPKKSNKELLIESYEWYKEHRSDVIGKVGTGHRVGWNFKLLNLVRKFL